MGSHTNISVKIKGNQINYSADKKKKNLMKEKNMLIDLKKNYSLFVIVDLPSTF